jgi:Flp pilus assembly protein TadD
MNQTANPRPITIDDAMRARLGPFARGELTWAEVEGITYDEARGIAQTGCELAAAGRLKEAQTIFEGLIAINPRDTSAHAALGTVHQRLGKPQEARASFDRALELFDGNVVALAARGELRLRHGDAEGIQDLVRAVEVDARGASLAGKRARAILGVIASRLQAKTERPRPPRRGA